MNVPIEYDPYGMMMELFLMEAAEIQADQILVVSREGHATLYFVSGNRVQRLVTLHSDISEALAIHIARKGSAVPTVKTVPIRVVDPAIAERVTLSMRKPSADVNCTMPMPPVLDPNM